MAQAANTKASVGTKSGDAGDGKLVDRDTLADAIVAISEGVKRLAASGLNRRAIIVLLRDSTGVGIVDISSVLNGLETLARDYARPK